MWVGNEIAEGGNSRLIGLSAKERQLFSAVYFFEVAIILDIICGKRAYVWLVRMTRIRKVAQLSPPQLSLFSMFHTTTYVTTIPLKNTWNVAYSRKYEVVQWVVVI